MGLCFLWLVGPNCRITNSNRAVFCVTCLTQVENGSGEDDVPPPPPAPPPPPLAGRPSGSGNRLPAEDALVPLAEESAAEGEPKRRKVRHGWNRLQVMGDGVHSGDLVWNEEKTS